jgi:hypothetical protein
MTDELRERLGRIDPMHPGVITEPVTTPSSRQLLEEIMSTTVEEQPTRAPRRRRLVVGLAAAVAVVAIFGGASIYLGDEGVAPIAAAPPLVLDAGDSNTLASCIQFSVDELAKAPLAFEGTVTSIEGETVTLTVDRWFKGGEAASVVVEAPPGMEALIGGIPFVAGQPYLVTAYDGTVNYCGFSGPATPELRAAFEEAFGG